MGSIVKLKTPQPEDSWWKKWLKAPGKLWRHEYKRRGGGLGWQLGFLPGGAGLTKKLADFAPNYAPFQNMKAGAHGEPLPADIKKLVKADARTRYFASERHMFHNVSRDYA
jgi:hypothetical protein